MTVERPPAGSIPTSPGSYQFKDEYGRTIYVGKAKNLRNRLSSYFQDINQLHPRTASMVTAAASVEWIAVNNEIEALILEHNLINQHRPRFNVRMRDDKSYPFLAVTVDEQWPRATIYRGARRKGVRYFGPFPHSQTIYETFELLLRTFPVRTCGPGKFKQHQRLGRPCLLFHIEKCSGPCVGEISAEDYREQVKAFVRFLDGDTDSVLESLRQEMDEASANLEYEQAARIRDRIVSVQRAVEKQLMVGERDEDIDVIGIADDDLEASVQVFYVRKGRVVGRKGFIVDKVEDLSPAGLVDRILEALYGDEPPLGIPQQVLVPHMPQDPKLYTEWLAHVRGSAVTIRIPLRGDKKDLLETVTNNAREEFVRHRMRRATDHFARTQALNDLQDYLQLPGAPLRIECYDMAHLQGTDYVGSMVVMEDGLPVKREYRRFKVHVPGNDDYAAMEEVLTRRLTAYLNERESGFTEDGDKPKKFAYPPQLLLVDGGKGQLAVAQRVVAQLGLEGEIPVAALAKRFEEVFVPGSSAPVRIPRGSEALFMLQRLRDEAHRFANTFHRERRSKRMVSSSLEDIPGLGEKRAKRLVKEMGSVTAVKTATREKLAELTWLPAPVADAVYQRFHEDDQPSE